MAKRKTKVAVGSAAQDDVLQRRRNNLRALAAQWNGVSGLSKKLGYTGPSYLSQMIGPQHNRPISEKTARHIEQVLGRASGWLDQDHHGITQEEPRTRNHSEPLFVTVSQALQDVLKEMGVTLTQEKAHAVFIRIYTEAQRRDGQVDPAFVRDLVQLAS